MTLKASDFYNILIVCVSFVGHLAGILVGLLYIKGPLKPLMDSVIPPGNNQIIHYQPVFY